MNSIFEQHDLFVKDVKIPRDRPMSWVRVNDPMYWIEVRRDLVIFHSGHIRRFAGFDEQNIVFVHSDGSVFPNTRELRFHDPHLVRKDEISALRDPSFAASFFEPVGQNDVRKEAEEIKMIARAVFFNPDIVDRATLR